MAIISLNDVDIIQNKPRASIQITSAVIDAIDTAQTWQKLDLSTGNPIIKAQGGFTWDGTNQRFVWDATSEKYSLTTEFIGDAQLQILDAISGTITLELGLVLNGVITPPVLITPTSYTNQAKISSYGANKSFSESTSPSPSDNRLVSTDYLEVWIRCTDVTATPNFSIDGFNVTFIGE